jgi:hypothetical protein
MSLDESEMSACNDKYVRLLLLLLLLLLFSYIRKCQLLNYILISRSYMMWKSNDIKLKFCVCVCVCARARAALENLNDYVDVNKAWKKVLDKL